METKFQLNDQVIATVNAQGLVKNHQYIVVGIKATLTDFGALVDYQLEPANAENENDRIWVKNAHMILELA